MATGVSSLLLVLCPHVLVPDSIYRLARLRMPSDLDSSNRHCLPAASVPTGHDLHFAARKVRRVARSVRRMGPDVIQFSPLAVRDCSEAEPNTDPQGGLGGCIVSVTRVCGEGEKSDGHSVESVRP